MSGKPLVAEVLAMSEKIEDKVKGGDSYYDAIIEIYNELLDTIEGETNDIMSRFIKLLSPEILYKLERDVRARRLMKFRNNMTTLF
jgi:hypothetical protein